MRSWETKSSGGLSVKDIQELNTYMQTKVMTAKEIEDMYTFYPPMRDSTLEELMNDIRRGEEPKTQRISLPDNAYLTDKLYNNSCVVA